MFLILTNLLKDFAFRVPPGDKKFLKTNAVLKTGSKSRVGNYFRLEGHIRNKLGFPGSVLVHVN